MGIYNATVITTAGQNLIADAIAGGEAVNFSSVKTSTHVYPAGTSLQNLTALDDVKQSVSPTSVEVYNNNVVQISARVPNTGISTAYLINTIGLFGQVTGGTETLIAVLTASTPDEVPEFDPESPAAFIFNVQMTIQNANEVTFEVNDSGTATVADINRLSNEIDLLDRTTTKMETDASTGESLSGAYTYGGVNPNNSEYFGIEFKRGTTPADRYRLQLNAEGLFCLYQRNADDSGWTAVDQLNINNAITNITRSGTTFTATRGDQSTFTFTQQDTWNANTTTVAGYVAAPTANKPRYFYSTGNDGSPAWRNNINVTGATSSANGTAGLVPAPTSANFANRTYMYLRSDGSWQYLPLANNSTTTAEHYALDARMGKTLQSNIDAVKDVRFGYYNYKIPTAINAGAVYTAVISYTTPSGYTPQGIIWITKDGTSNGYLLVSSFSVNATNSNASVTLYNAFSQAFAANTITLHVKVLFIKS